MDFNWLASVKKTLLDCFLLEQKFIEQWVTHDEMMSRYILIYKIMLVDSFLN